MDSKGNGRLTISSKRVSRAPNPDPNFDYSTRRTPSRRLDCIKTQDLSVNIVCVRPGQIAGCPQKKDLDELASEGWGVPKAALNKKGKCNLPMVWNAAALECFIREQFPQLTDYELMRSNDKNQLISIPVSMYTPGKLQPFVSERGLFIRPITDVKPAIVLPPNASGNILKIDEENYQRISDLISETLRTLLCSSIAYTKHITLNAALSLGVDSMKEIDISIEEKWSKTGGEEKKKQTRIRRRGRPPSTGKDKAVIEPIVILPLSDEEIVTSLRTKDKNKEDGNKDDTGSDKEKDEEKDHEGETSDDHNLSAPEISITFPSGMASPTGMESDKDAEKQQGEDTTNSDDGGAMESKPEEGEIELDESENEMREDEQDEDDADFCPAEMSELDNAMESDIEDDDGAKSPRRKKRKRSNEDIEYSPRGGSSGKKGRRPRGRPPKIKEEGEVKEPKKRRRRGRKRASQTESDGEDLMDDEDKMSKIKRDEDGKPKHRMNKKMTLAELEYYKEMYTILVPSKINRRGPRKKKHIIEIGGTPGSPIKLGGEEEGTTGGIPLVAGEENNKPEDNQVEEQNQGEKQNQGQEDKGEEQNMDEENNKGEDGNKCGHINKAEDCNKVEEDCEGEEDMAEEDMKAEEDIKAEDDMKGYANASKDERLFSPSRLEKYGENHETALSTVRMNKMSARLASKKYNIPYDVLCAEVNKTRFECNICGNRFSAPSHIRRHLSMHLAGRNFQCERCEKKFNCIENLRRHQVVHDTKHEQVCETCGETFLWKASLIRHQMKHRGERPHVCSVCSKTFITIYDLKSHMHLHTGVKDFVCAECGMPFARSSGLNAHMKTAHTELRTFECKECGKSFKMKHALVRHMRNHTGVEVYKCEICGKGFKWFTSRKLHMKKHEKETIRNETRAEPALPPPINYRALAADTLGVSLGTFQGEDPIDIEDTIPESNNVQRIAIRLNQLMEPEVTITDGTAAAHEMMDSVVLTTTQGDVLPRVTVAQVPLLDGHTSTMLTPTIIDPIIVTREAAGTGQKTYLEYHTLKTIVPDGTLNTSLEPQ